MEYLSGYYWQQGDVRTSLVLKQLVYHEGGVPVLFGCMQSCGNGKLVEVLTDWFYQEGLQLCRRRGVEPERLEMSLKRVIPNSRDKDLSFTVLLCVDDCFLLWNQGKQSAYLLNTRFGRPCAKCVAAGKEEKVIVGKLQQEVGILVVTEGFGEGLSLQQIRECLAVGELHSEERVHKRMQELGRKACELGGQHVGALLAVTC